MATSCDDCRQDRSNDLDSAWAGMPPKVTAAGAATGRTRAAAASHPHPGGVTSCTPTRGTVDEAGGERFRRAGRGGETAVSEHDLGQAVSKVIETQQLS